MQVRPFVLFVLKSSSWQAKTKQDLTIYLAFQVVDSRLRRSSLVVRTVCHCRSIHILHHFPTSTVRRCHNETSEDHESRKSLLQNVAAIDSEGRFWLLLWKLWSGPPPEREWTSVAFRVQKLWRYPHTPLTGYHQLTLIQISKRLKMHKRSGRLACSTAKEATNSVPAGKKIRFVHLCQVLMRSQCN